MNSTHQSNIFSIVTGAAGTLGTSICYELLKNQHTVLGIIKPNGNICKAELFHNPNFTSIEFDLSETAEINYLYQKIIPFLNTNPCKIINLIHAAGIYAKQQLPCQNADIELWNKMFNIHCKALYSIINFLMPYLQQVEKSNIIGISTNLTHRVNHGSCAYIASKAALEAMLKQLAYELGHLNVRCNCIAPGYFKSDMSKGIDANKEKQICTQTPLNKIASHMDITDVILALLDDKFHWVTGQTIIADGGNTIGF